MSEYQYYEFAAIDQPLTPRQQAELRERSSRAVITATGFTNEYHWGDLKGDPVDWMNRYFDAHVYSANWGSCRLLLRLPRTAMEAEALAAYCGPPVSGTEADPIGAFDAVAKPAHWILDWNFSDDSGEEERFWSQTDGPGWMARLLPLRDELLRGDARPLYLGWLARVSRGELAGDDIEPPLPAGLRTLTPAQAALTEFLLIDPDWLAAAAETSADLGDQADDAPAINAWLDVQDPDALRATLRRLLQGHGQEAERALRGQFLAWQRTQQATGPATEARRNLAQIDTWRGVAEARRIERERQAQEALAAQRRAERNQHLTRLADRANAAWDAIDTCLQRGSGAAYDQALNAVKELAEALALTGREAEFRRTLVQRMASHGKRAAWVARLNKAGFL